MKPRPPVAFIPLFALMLSLAALAAAVEIDEVKWGDQEAWRCARTLSLSPFTVSGEFKGKRPQQEYLDSFQKGLVDGLKGERGLQEVILADKADMAKADLHMTVEFLELTTGSRAARFWVGFGAGKSQCEVRITCTRASDGAKVFALKHAKISAAGLDSDELQENVDEVCRDVVGFLMAHRTPCPRPAEEPAPPPESPQAPTTGP